MSTSIEEYAKKTNVFSEDILNYYRNLYYKEPVGSEKYIVAMAIDDILPKYTNLKTLENPKYTLEFLNYDGPISEGVLYKGSKRQCIEFADKIIIKILKNKQGLLGELNDMQIEANDCNLFNDKFAIPDYFINLLLYKYNIRIRVNK